LHADETGWRKNGVTHWLWCFTTKKLSRLLKDTLRLSEKKSHVSPECFLRLKKRLYHRLEQFLATPCQDKDAQRLIKRLNCHKHELFMFLEYEGVSPYNNHAEQQMRKPVLTRKVSQQNRTEQACLAADRALKHRQFS
jgi:hypothetical protein